MKTEECKKVDVRDYATLDRHDNILVRKYLATVTCHTVHKFIVLFCILFADIYPRPNLLTLLSFPSKKRNINIPKQISTKYFMFGILLLNDETGAEVRTITTKHHQDAELINLEILSLWIEGKGKPLTWGVLIDVLKTIGLDVLANDIEEGIQHPRSASESISLYTIGLVYSVCVCVCVCVCVGSY